LNENINASSITATESGGHSLRTSFWCKSSLAQGFADQLIAQGHPTYRGMLTTRSSVTINDSLSGIATISAAFFGALTTAAITSTTQAAGRVATSRPLNYVQSEYEIFTVQSYQPISLPPTAIWLNEIPPKTFDTGNLRLSLYPVIESVSFTQLANGIYEVKYLVTVREIGAVGIGKNSALLWNGFISPDSPGIVLESIENNPFTIRSGPTFSDNTPKTKISLARLTFGAGLDVLAQATGTSINRGYYRTAGSVAGVNMEYMQPTLYPYGPPRILPEVAAMQAETAQVQEFISIA
jgi:hypothetical protein